MQIDTALTADLEGHLEHIAGGGQPTPETAAGLLRRLREARQRPPGGNPPDIAYPGPPER